MSDLLNSSSEAASHSLRSAPLPSLAVISVSGADAVSFLHGQITQDVQNLSNEARLAGYCSPKGRLLATLAVWQTNAPDGLSELHLLMRADIAQAVVKRLSMFVLRAKAKLTITTATVTGLSIDANQAADLGQTLGTTLPTAPWQLAHLPQGIWITAPSADPTRLRGWLINEAGDQTSTEANASEASWDAEDIAAGLPWIGATTQDLFIPQTLNLDLIGGVSFTKGCYPGQEVVARSHYRGTVKRRMAAGTATATPDALPGVDVFQASRDDAPCGRIINAATVGDTTQLLFEAPFDAVDEGDLRIGAANGTAINVVPLPYPTRG